MTVRSTTYAYEQSSEAGRERNIQWPYARLADQTPTVGDPCQMTGLLPGAQMTGTVVTINPTASVVIANIAVGAIYRHNVRNVTGYDGADNENAWGAINIGDPVYYDPTSDANNGIKLSTSVLQGDAATSNPRFGTIGMLQDQVAGDFPSSESALSDLYAVIQAGIVES